MKLAWIGTGIMGCAMAGHLCKAGHELSVFTRTEKKAAPLLEMGATWAKSPLDAASNADIVFSIVGFPSDVEEVILGEQGALKGLKEGGILCDMTTSSPSLAQTIAKEAAQKGCFSLDAPVTGGDIGAKNATLSIFVGGEKSAFDKVLPYFEVMGQRILHFGDAGTGQIAKLGNQVAIAGVMFSLCESIAFVQEAGLDVEKWLEAVKAGAAGSAAMTNIGPRIIQKNYAPGFFVEHFLKDLKLCIEQCKVMNLNLPGLALAEKTYAMFVEQGYAKEGTQIFSKLLEERTLFQ